MSITHLFRRETLDESKIAEDAACFDDVDLIEGPDGKLGMVAVNKGRRVCQRCGDQFDQSDKRMRMTPVWLWPGAPPVYLHAKCEKDPVRIFQTFKGLGVRRSLAKIAKATLGLDKAAKSGEDRIIGS